MDQNEISDELNEARRSLQYAVINICSSLDRQSNTKTSIKALQAISALTYQYAAGSLAQDLDDFCGHAGRKTISVDDVKLVLRKSSDLQHRLGDFCEQRHGIITAGKGMEGSDNLEEQSGHRPAGSFGSSRRRSSPISSKKFKRKSGTIDPLPSPSKKKFASGNSKRLDHRLSSSSSSDESIGLEFTTKRKIQGDRINQRKQEGRTNVCDSNPKGPVSSRERKATRKPTASSRRSVPNKCDILDSSSSSSSSSSDEFDIARKRIAIKKGGVKSNLVAKASIAVSDVQREAFAGEAAQSQAMKIMAQLSPNSGASEEEEVSGDSTSEGQRVSKAGSSGSGFKGKPRYPNDTLARNSSEKGKSADIDLAGSSTEEEEF